MQSSHILALTIVIAALFYALIERVLKNRHSKPRREEVEARESMMLRIEELEERVRVLEQIVTDPRESLSRKINNL